MSMSSAWYAEYAEKVRKQWVEQLDNAVIDEDWKAVRRLLLEMDTYRFTE
jgi:hypothetical protein